MPPAPAVTLQTDPCPLSAPPGEEFSLLRNLTAAFEEDDAHCVVRFANSLFLQQGIAFNPEFLHLMRKYFKADVQTVDFGESAAVAEQINSWVENHTESKRRRGDYIFLDICFFFLCAKAERLIKNAIPLAS